MDEAPANYFLWRPRYAERRAQILCPHQLAVAHDELDLAEIANVLRRIAVDQGQLRELALDDGAGLLFKLEHFRWIDRRCR
jgi:hypothetical protein